MTPRAVTFERPPERTGRPHLAGVAPRAGTRMAAILAHVRAHPGRSSPEIYRALGLRADSTRGELWYLAHERGLIVRRGGRYWPREA